MRQDPMDQNNTGPGLVLDGIVYGLPEGLTGDFEEDTLIVRDEADVILPESTSARPER